MENQKSEKPKVIVYVLAGGSGTRLAPLSLSNMPKQYLALLSNKTIIQETIERIPRGVDINIVTVEKYRDIIKEQVGDKIGIVAEPFGCNTAIAIGFAAIDALKKTGDIETILFIKPADHHMNSDYFQKYFWIASKEARNDKIVTIGITPEKPETIYGYIKTKNCLVDKYEDGQICEVDCFVEKPNFEKAKEYFESGQFYWNSGMFCFSIKTILESLEKHSPIIYQSLREIEKALGTEREADIISKEYTKVMEAKENISIDYAVMEKEAENILLVKAKEELEWNDIGGWNALARYCENDIDNNFKKGSTKINNCKTVLVLNYLSNDINLNVDNLSDHLVVASKNGILIAPRSSAPRAKECVKYLEDGELKIIIDSKNTTVKNDLDIPVIMIDCDAIEVKVSGKEIVVSGLQK